MMMCGLLGVLLFSGCGLVKDRLLGDLESPQPIEGARTSSYGLSFADSTIALAGVEGDSDAWSQQQRSTTWETATIPGTQLNNFGYRESSWTFGSDGPTNVPDGGVRYRGVNGREIILVGDTGAAPSVPDPDGIIDECFSRVPPRLTLLVGTSLTVSTIGAGQFQGLGAEVGLRWMESFNSSRSHDSADDTASLQWIAEYTRGHARSFHSDDDASGERTERGEFLLGYTPARSSIGLQLGWRIDTIHQYGGIDQVLDFSGPVVQLGWEFGPKGKSQKSPEEDSDDQPL
ncbi:MAG: hypothetical protein OSB09_05945 [Planctomycetota bacterium]|nr:hypothetical protein [Planctomycetota bacterium]